MGFESPNIHSSVACKHGMFPEFCAICTGTARPVKSPMPAGWTGRTQSTTSVQAGWSLTLKDGSVITICAVCQDIANDHESLKLERTVKLVAYVRTNLCKDCGEEFDEEQECPATGDVHRRKWMIRSIKAAACPKCAGRSEYRVEADDLAVEDGKPVIQTRILRAWEIALRQKRLID